MFIGASQHIKLNRACIIAFFLSFLFACDCSAGHFALAFQRKQPAWENGDEGFCGGAACRVWVWDESGKPLKGIKLQTSWDILLGETDEDGRAQFNTTADHHNYDVLCTDNIGSTSDITRLMIKNLLNCSGRQSYEVGFLYKSDAANPGTFDLDLMGDWPEPSITFNQAPYTKSLAYSGVDYRDQYSDASHWGNWQGSSSYFGQTFIATGNRVVSARVHGTIGGLGQLDWKLRIVTFPELKQVGPETSVPYRWPFGWQAFWGSDDVKVVPGQKYMLQVWREGDGMNIYSVLKDVYPDGEYYEGTTAFPGKDLNGHICCMMYGPQEAGGLAGLWEMDEGQGNIVNDSSGNNHNGFYPSQQWSDEGRFGSAMLLNGDNLLRIPDYYGVYGGLPRTCSAWIRTTNEYGDIIYWGKNGEAGRKWRIRVTDGGLLRLEVSGGVMIGSSRINTGNWEHIAVVLPDDSNRIKDVIMYVNGKQEDPEQIIFYDHEINTASYDKLHIGSDGNTYFQGMLDDVAVFNAALTEKQIAQLYSLGGSSFLRPCGDVGFPAEDGLIGDVDKDCSVSISDLLLVAGQWLSEGISAGDVSGDKKVNIHDLSAISEQWNETFIFEP